MCASGGGKAVGFRYHFLEGASLLFFVEVRSEVGKVVHSIISLAVGHVGVEASFIIDVRV